MASRTQLFQLLPWSGGLNSALDESLIPTNQLTIADNITFDTRGSRKMRDGVNHNWDSLASGSDSVIGEHDYWFGSSTRSQRLLSVRASGAIYSKNAGTASLLTDAGTAWTGTLDNCSIVTFNNKAIIAVPGSTNVIKYWDGSSDIADLPGSPPTGSILRTHLGRLWTNDNARPDRLYYSQTSDHTIWGGTGDSGAIDIGVGDGDPVGITAIFPTFKGDLFVAKKTKLYRLVGQTPEEFQVIKVSDGIGCVSHNSVVAVGQDDIFWVSEKGVHSLQAVASYGDFTSNDVSVDIQRTFNEDIDRTRLPYVWGAYLENINSVAFTFTEESGLNRSLTTSAVNNALYLFNVPQKAWYRWSDMPCQTLIVANDSDRKRFYLGTHTGRTIKTFNGTNYDVTSAGAQSAIRLRVATGQILLDSNPYTMKALKRFGLVYRPRGTHNISVTIKVDNYNVDPENTLSFNEVNSTALLGSTFTLGTSILGYDSVLSAYTRTIDGIGRSVKVTIEQSQIDSEVEIQGFFIEFEPAGAISEVFLR
jgi:hypothetical protein